MFRITGPVSQACDGINRRDLLRIGSLSLLPTGIALPQHLAAQQSSIKRPAAAQSVILLNLFGGPSHIDMFDMKPQAPSQIRGEFKPISTSLPGLQICEHLPRIATWMNRGSLIRTITHSYNSHHPYTLLTGYSKATNTNPARPQPTNHPSMGSICHYFGLNRPGAVPQVFIPDYPGYTQNPRPGGYGGYLGKGYDPLFTSCRPQFSRKGSFYDPVTPIGRPLPPSMNQSSDITVGRLHQRYSLLQQVGRNFNALSTSPNVVGMNKFQQQAFSLLTSGKTRDAFDLDREPERVHQRYGRNLYGQSMLTARRLVEAGTTFVTVNWEVAVETHGGHWDMHQKNFAMLKSHLPILDQMVTALLDDLDKRGRLSSTLVVVTGEMGRTPKVNAKAGRDHWPSCGFCLLFGGGIGSGRVYGKSDKHGGYPIEDPVTPGDLVATIYQLLGIDPTATVPDRLNRPIHISHGGKAIAAIQA